MTQIKTIFYIFISVVLTACAGPKVKLDSNYWGAGAKTIAVIIDPVPAQAAAYKEGMQGLLDIAINNAMASGLEGHLKTINVQEAITIKQTLEAKLTKMGHKTIQIEPSLTYDKLPDFKTPSSEGVFSKKDVKSLLKDEKADALLFIYTPKVGTVRSYYSFIPLGAPKATATFAAEMVSASNNRILANLSTTFITPIEGSWDQSPDYPNVSVAIIKNLQAVQTLFATELLGK
ncbi:hypothetical protein [Nitrosomonas sp. Nm33]|uniref:hypothetical protein n=1 Tax=Nitrosomonas sp. Nm33 TaxID=133724 RepID=UPI00089776EA|nr:hypothetical protein [Nitrosomonas sp. Nm33]SDY17912.1 hypothetical protein SAMN05421755_101045 [Nitrosomonas sp. Nm33]